MPHPLLRAALAAVALLTAAAPVVAADPVEWRTDYTTARKEAEEKSLPLLVVVGTEQCVYCRKLEATTFVDKDVLAMLAGKVVLLKVDANKEADFVRAMRITIYPTTVIAGTDGKVFAYLAGYQSADQFKEHATKAFGLIAAADKQKGRPNGDAVLTSRTKPDVKAAPPAEAATDSLTLAKEAFKAERYAEVLERAELIAAKQPNTPAGEEAVGLIAAVKADSDKLARAGEQLDEKFAAAYFAVAEGFELKGKTKDATGHFEKVIVAAPNSKYAERARARVAAIVRAELDSKLIK
jgi:thioredoxin-like negative regulator of GroEL